MESVSTVTREVYLEEFFGVLYREKYAKGNLAK